jgi:hypothetical protein
MANPHPFTVIGEGDLISITGWTPVPGFYGIACNLPVNGFTQEQYNTNEDCFFFRLSHGETAIGLVTKKYKQKKKEFMLILINDITVRLERGRVHTSNFSIGRIAKTKPNRKNE